MLTLPARQRHTRRQCRRQRSIAAEAAGAVVAEAAEAEAALLAASPALLAVLLAR